jgi:FKBP-type peptidyl-prolyl cis-trans isomerase 2
MTDKESKVNKGDFIELDYTGKLSDGSVFDTTLEQVAKENNLPTENRTFSPATVCVGEQQLLPGLDNELVDKELDKEYTINLPTELAFGKRDIKKMKVVPISTFKDHKVQPQPGLQIDVDGERGTISRVSGGRVIVNFNHPLAGKEIIYIFKINRKITDKKEQIACYLNSTMQLPKDKISIEINENKANIKLPVNLPEQITSILSKKLESLVKLKEIIFSTK